MMSQTEIILTGILAIIGPGGIIQLIKAIKAWRDGIKQKETDADDRALARAERAIEKLEAERNADTEYIRQLMNALSKAGADIPPRGT